jgi:hypothetical protein
LQKKELLDAHHTLNDSYRRAIYDCASTNIHIDLRANRLPKLPSSTFTEEHKNFWREIRDEKQRQIIQL